MTIARFIFAFLLFSAASAALAAEGTVQIRESVTVAGPRVTLGDLFVNTGEAAGISVAKSPQPGKSVAARAPWLARIAKTHRIDWKPEHPDVLVVVTRAGQLISRDEVEMALLDALSDRVNDDRLGLEFTTRRVEFHVASLDIPEIGVENLRYEPRNRYFTATIRVPAGDPTGAVRKVTGRVHRVAEVPVVIQPVLKGEVIRDTDIRWQRVRVDKLRGDFATEQDQVVGLAARRHLRADTPLRRQDLERPLLVKKRQMVTIILRHGAMSMTARGKAEENGALGEVVSVRNNSSGRIIDTEVVGPDMVAVTLGRPNHLALNMGAAQ